MTTEELLREYPFLQQKDFKGTPIAGYTFLDDLPRGWVIRFGEQLCKDIKIVLKENNLLDKYEIYEVKEKYCGLRWYDNYPEVTRRIISYYDKLATHTCLNCGAEASKNFDIPFCDNCRDSHILLKLN